MNNSTPIRQSSSLNTYSANQSTNESGNENFKRAYSLRKPKRHPSQKSFLSGHGSNEASTSEIDNNKTTSLKRTKVKSTQQQKHVCFDDKPSVIHNYDFTEQEKLERLEYVRKIKKNQCGIERVTELESQLEEMQEGFTLAYKDKLAKEKKLFIAQKKAEYKIDNAAYNENHKQFQHNLEVYEQKQKNKLDEFIARIEESAEIKIEVQQSYKEKLYDLELEIKKAKSDYNEAYERYENWLTIKEELEQKVDKAEAELERMTSQFEDEFGEDPVETNEAAKKAENNIENAFQKLDDLIESFNEVTEHLDKKEKICERCEHEVAKYKQKLNDTVAKCEEERFKKSERVDELIGLEITEEEVINALERLEKAKKVNRHVRLHNIEEELEEICLQETNQQTAQTVMNVGQSTKKVATGSHTTHQDHAIDLQPSKALNSGNTALLRHAIESLNFELTDSYEKSLSINGKKLLDGKYDLRNHCINTCMALWKALEESQSLEGTGFKIKLATIEEPGDERTLHNMRNSPSIPDYVANSYIVFEDCTNGKELIFDPIFSSILPGLKNKILPPNELREHITQQIISNPKLLAQIELGCWLPTSTGYTINRFLLGKDHSEEAFQKVAGLLFSGMYGISTKPVNDKNVSSNEANVAEASNKLQKNHQKDIKVHSSSEQISGIVPQEKREKTTKQEAKAVENQKHHSAVITPYNPDVAHSSKPVKNTYQTTQKNTQKKATSKKVYDNSEVAIAPKSSQGKLRSDSAYEVLRESVALKTTKGKLTSDFVRDPSTQQSRMVTMTVGAESTSQQIANQTKPSDAEIYAIQKSANISIKKLPKHTHKDTDKKKVQTTSKPENNTSVAIAKNVNRSSLNDCNALASTSSQKVDKQHKSTSKGIPYVTTEARRSKDLKITGSAESASANVRLTEETKALSLKLKRSELKELSELIQRQSLASTAKQTSLPSTNVHESSHTITYPKTSRKKGAKSDAISKSKLIIKQHEERFCSDELRVHNSKSKKVHSAQHFDKSPKESIKKAKKSSPSTTQADSLENKQAIGSGVLCQVVKLSEVPELMKAKRGKVKKDFISKKSISVPTEYHTRAQLNRPYYRSISEQPVQQTTASSRHRHTFKTNDDHTREFAQTRKQKQQEHLVKRQLSMDKAIRREKAKQKKLELQRAVDLINKDIKQQLLKKAASEEKRLEIVKQKNFLQAMKQERLQQEVAEQQMREQQMREQQWLLQQAAEDQNIRNMEEEQLRREEEQQQRIEEQRRQEEEQRELQAEQERLDAEQIEVEAELKRQQEELKRQQEELKRQEEEQKRLEEESNLSTTSSESSYFEVTVGYCEQMLTLW